MTAKILIERASKGWVDRYRLYEVMVNGELVGKIGRGETRTIESDSGPIEIYLKIDWCRSRAIRLDLDPGAKARLYCRPRSLLTAFYGISFGRTNYIQVEPR